jgi:hypothetical protein
MEDTTGPGPGPRAAVSAHARRAPRARGQTHAIGQLECGAQAGPLLQAKALNPTL